MSNTRRVVIARASTGIGTNHNGVVALRLLDGSYADFNLPFLAGVNEFYDLLEDAGTTYSSYYDDLPMGTYRFVIRDDTTTPPTPVTISTLTDIHHNTSDVDTHLEDTTAISFRHIASTINIDPALAPRFGNEVMFALEAIAGSTWETGTHDSLLEHLESTTAHDDDAIVSSVGVGGTAEDVLSDHETRITALETGTAIIPENIDDISGEIGIDLYWDAQDVEGIEYYVRYLWKHTYEGTPSFTNLQHQSRIGSPFFNVNYGTRRFDIAINTESDLVLYYAIGAKGRGDVAISWSDVLSTGVEIPKYRQEQIITLSSISLDKYTGAGDIGSEHIDSPELFPTCSAETGGVPDDNFLIWSPMDDVTIKQIRLRSGSAMSGNATVKYLSSAGDGEFTVSSAIRRGQTGDISLNVDDGEDLQIWSLNPQGIGHYTIQIKFQIRE